MQALDHMSVELTLSAAARWGELAVSEAVQAGRSRDQRHDR